MSIAGALLSEWKGDHTTNGSPLMLAIATCRGLCCLAIVAWAGCAAPSETVKRAEIREQGLHLLRDKEVELAAARSVIASTKIAAAKQEAELIELRTSAQQLRQENLETHQALSKLRQEKQSSEQETIIARAEAATQVQATESQEVVELKNTVAAMSQEIEQLKQGLTATIAQLSKSSSSHSHPSVSKDNDTNGVASAAQRQKTDRRSVSDTDDKLHIGGIHRTSYNTVDGSDVQVTVKAGDTLLKLSRAFKVSPSEIRRANRMNDSKIQVGQVLLIPFSDRSEP